MIILRRIPRRFLRFKNPVAAIGIFDGVHRGHQSILRCAATRAGAIAGTPMVVTFHPHPAVVVAPAYNPQLLLSLEQRLEVFEKCGMKATLVIPFTKSFSRWTPEAFVEKVLVKGLRAREVIIGHDFGFGIHRSGSIATLKEYANRYGFKIHVVPPFTVGTTRVASRTIRQFIREGKLVQAARFLGRPPSVVGRVVHGVGRGKKLGFKTANVDVKAGILPPIGVYAVKTMVRRRLYGGMANLGFRPTFGKKKGRPILEIHLFGLKKSIYDQKVEVAFLKFLRPERKFPSAEALSRQLTLDAAGAKYITAHFSFAALGAAW